MPISYQLILDDVVEKLVIILMEFYAFLHKRTTTEVDKIVETNNTAVTSCGETIILSIWKPQYFIEKFHFFQSVGIHTTNDLL